MNEMRNWVILFLCMLMCAAPWTRGASAHELCCAQDGGVCGDRCCNGRPLADHRAPYYPYCGQSHERILDPAMYSRDVRDFLKARRESGWYPGTPVAVVINGETLQQPGFVSGNWTLVPARGVFEAMGATVQWDPRTRRIVIERYGKTVVLTIGAPAADIFDQRKSAASAHIAVPLDIPPPIFEQQAFIPLRFVAEAFGAEVRWDGVAGAVFITISDNPDARFEPPPPRDAPCCDVEVNDESMF